MRVYIDGRWVSRLMSLAQEQTSTDVRFTLPLYDSARAANRPVHANRCRCDILAHHKNHHGAGFSPDDFHSNWGRSAFPRKMGNGRNSIWSSLAGEY
jgi:hypothetical protein